ncbi:Putative general secretion pathway protein, GspF-like [Desulfonema limicola]|uniref:General secretion pathway protein, GspF-like n=1 Tax=Desulfonema limicola TaxID=45656 RepID=A0A975B5U3_9BACT|nr:type II secretion system F family protein [Desulfonema limicola]QTA79326.1 Putative general secretion pathway protein, GspF-like [Desulfonema limicola]
MKYSYSYQALNDEGNTISGTLNAVSKDAANNTLLNMGFLPYKIKKINTLSFSWLGIFNKFNPVNFRDLIIFTKQFKTLVNAGVSMMEIWQIMESQTEDKKLKTIIQSISKEIKEGSSLYNAFKKHPQTFSVLYCSIIQAGESSGALPSVLARLTDIMEHDYKIKSDIKSALRYPAFVIMFLIIAFMIQITFVIPRFAKVFESRGVALPLPTRMCIEMYNFIHNYWYIVLIVIAGTALFLFVYLKADRIKYLRDLLLIKLPIFGSFRPRNFKLRNLQY